VYKGVDARDKPGHDGSGAMLGFIKKSSANGEASERVRDWTRARFTLTDDDTIMVSEVACGLPGCPPIETHLVFWTARGRHHFKIFKPLAEVGEDDMPPAFMKDALIVLDGADADCC
jgi:nitrate reductase delta subunit